MKYRVQLIVNRIKLCLFNLDFKIRVEYDGIYYNPIIDDGRVYIQIVYTCKDVRTDKEKEWRGRKWYLSEYMTDDEIIKTCYTAYEACIKHEIMETFKVDDIILFNPHVNYEELLKISHKEITRK